MAFSSSSHMDRVDTDDLNVVSWDPPCSETVLSGLDSWITPIERFYVRSHFSAIPDIDVSSWRLKVEGEVDTSMELSYEDLRSLPTRSLIVTLECAGNSRSYLTPPAEGLRFGHGAVGNAEWTGVPLSELLLRAGPKKEVTEVLFEGADLGEEEEEGLTLQLGYARSLPIEQAMSEDTLVAYLMNGEPLEPSHGCPARLVVPGWYGMASVKWLHRVSLLSRPYQGFFQSRRYVNITDGESLPQWEPVTSVQVKSLITRPRHGEVVSQDQYTVHGVAWSGVGTIKRQELSTDGGRSWQEAELLEPESAYAWRRWKFQWTSLTPGHFILMARATDSTGNTQLATVPWNFRGYANNSIHTIAVEVPKE